MGSRGCRESPGWEIGSEDEQGSPREEWTEDRLISTHRVRMPRTPWDVLLDLLQVQWPRSKAKPIMQHQISRWTDLVRVYLMGCSFSSANKGSLEVLDSVYGKAQPSQRWRACVYLFILRTN